MICVYLHFAKVLRITRKTSAGGGQKVFSDTTVILTRCGFHRSPALIRHNPSAQITVGFAQRFAK
jgi:hypothetical protein